MLRWLKTYLKSIGSSNICWVLSSSYAIFIFFTWSSLYFTFLDLGRFLTLYFGHHLSFIQLCRFLGVLRSTSPFPSSTVRHQSFFETFSCVNWYAAFPSTSCTIFPYVVLLKLANIKSDRFQPTSRSFEVSSACRAKFWNSRLLRCSFNWGYWKVPVTVQVGW